MPQKKALSHILFMVFLVISLLVGASTALLSTMPSNATYFPSHMTLTWTGDPRTTQTITWKTDVTTVAGQVQYAEAVDGNSFPHNAQTVAAEVEQFSTNLGDMSIHSVTLNGLKPGTRYLYRVGDGAAWSEPHAFVTSAANVSGFKFLVFGDSQSINYGVWRTTLQQAYQANSDAVFFTNVGDLVDVGQDYAQWNAWFNAAQEVIATIPAMPVTGNHEAYTPERLFSMPVFFTTQFKLPPNGPERLKRQVYSFDYGDVHFIVLDSQAGEEERFVPDMLDQQRAWLEKDLQMNDKKWKVVFMHRPPYNNKAPDANANIRRAFVPIFDKYHADVVFTGHDHVYARTYPLYRDMIVDSAAKGTVYVATGRSGTKTYKDTVIKDWDQFFHDSVSEPNYLTVEVKDNVLTVKAFTQSGTLIDAWSIEKAAGQK